MTELVSKIENHDTLRSFRSCVPRRQCPQTPWDEPRLGDAQEESSCDEGPIVRLKRLEGTNSAEEEQLQSKPKTRSHTVKCHIRWDLE